jgi:uncharacterized membrane protein YbhN (UPF0104 family)
VLIGIAVIVVILTVPAVFDRIHSLVAHIPFLNRLLPVIDELQEETVKLLHHRDARALVVLDAARVACAVTSFWLIVDALGASHFSWLQAAFVLALSTIGGAVSLLPGGVGANEATVAAALVLLGFARGLAGAAAIIQRVLITGLSLGLGLGAYALIHKRLHLRGRFQLVARAPAAASPTA